MNRKVVAELWDEYALRVISPQSPPIQFLECRLAFYAGAASIFYTMQSGVSEGAGDATPEDMNLMQGITDEIAEFQTEQLDLRTQKAHSDRQRSLALANARGKRPA